MVHSHLSVMAPPNPAESHFAFSQSSLPAVAHFRFVVAYLQTPTAGQKGWRMDQLLSRRQAAAMLGMSTGTLDRLTRTGFVQAVRIGPRTVRYSVEALREAMRPKAQA